MPTSLEKICDFLKPDIIRGWRLVQSQPEDYLEVHIHTQVYRNLRRQNYLRLQVYVRNEGNFVCFLVDPFLRFDKRSAAELYQKLLGVCMETSLVQFELCRPREVAMTIEHPVLDAEFNRAQFLYCCQTMLDVAELYFGWLGN